MTRETDYIIQTMFERENLDEMTLDELQAKVEQYPYSSIIRYLHTLKLKETYDRHYPEAVSTTALYFSNPHWLYYQLSDDSERGIIKKFFSEDYEDQASEMDDLTNSDEIEYNEEFEGEEIIPEEHDFDPSYKEQYNSTESDEVIGNIDDDCPEESHVVIPTIEELKLSISEPVSTNQPVFEPYHMVDYFASQGIKLGNIDEKDVLGQKVKSFTAWLKTMKRIEPDASHQVIPFSKDNDSVNSTNDLVITETMAEVFIKQGAFQKAIDVYTKLSLQNPANSHIFVARIKEIKEKLI